MGTTLMTMMTMAKQITFKVTLNVTLSLGHQIQIFRVFFFIN